MKVKIILDTWENGQKGRLVVFGEKTIENGMKVVRYEEVGEKDSKLSRAVMKYSDDKIEIEKKGDMSMMLLFSKAQSHEFQIVTDYGAFQGEIVTRDYVLSESFEGEEIYIDYVLTVSGADSIRRRMEITVTEFEE